jgi:hypothetical protein
MFLKKCSQCGKETLGKICSLCKKQKEKDPYGVLVGTSGTEVTPIENYSQGEQSEVDGANIKPDHDESSKKPKRKTVTPYLAILTGLIIAGYALTQVNYEETQQSIVKMVSNKPEKIEEKIEIKQTPPYTILRKNEERKQEELKLQLKCDAKYKPVVPLGIIKGEKNESTLLISVVKPLWGERCSNYKVTDGVEEVKAIKIETKTEGLELYVVNIPLTGLEIKIDKNLMQGEKYIVLINKKLELNSIEQIETNAETLLGLIKAKETFIILDSEKNIIKIFTEGKEAQLKSLCGNILKC